MAYIYLLEKGPVLLVIIGFVIIHIIPKFKALSVLNSRTLISFSAGVGVAYVVINLFPYLSYSQLVLNQRFGWGDNKIFDYTIYVVLLFGFVFSYMFYKLDEKEMSKLEKNDPDTFKFIYFWSEISFYAIYNLMIGYLVATGSMKINTNLLIYFIAFGLHFLMIGCVLRYHHQDKYDRFGWVVLAASVFFGGTLGIFVKLPIYIVSLFKAFITGVMTLNVIKFELPGENEGSLKGFLTGVIIATILFLLI